MSNKPRKSVYMEASVNDEAYQKNSDRKRQKVTGMEASVQTEHHMSAEDFNLLRYFRQNKSSLQENDIQQMHLLERKYILLLKEQKREQDKMKRNSVYDFDPSVSDTQMSTHYSVPSKSVRNNFTNQSNLVTEPCQPPGVIRTNNGVTSTNDCYTSNSNFGSEPVYRTNHVKKEDPDPCLSNTIRIPDTKPRMDYKSIKREVDVEPNCLKNNNRKHSETHVQSLKEELKFSTKQEYVSDPRVFVSNGKEEYVLSSDEEVEIPVHKDMSARTIISCCRSRGDSATNLHILHEDRPSGFPPCPPDSLLNRDQLLPSTVSVFVENKATAFSPQLHEFCLKHPIAVVRNLASVLGLDLGLFSTKTLVESNPDHRIELRIQTYQSSDRNMDVNQPHIDVWPCFSRRDFTTITKYAQYQSSTYQEAIELSPNLDLDVDKVKKSLANKTIKFGTNLDLSCEKKWDAQLKELEKLPALFKLESERNMLSHVGHQILGMNTVQLYMKVPGSRTPGHQENNNFCAVNINIGPGNCEWFGVPDDYWGVIAKQCEDKGTRYLHDSWWPDLKELFAANVPVYRFMQKPGDLVWINSGCVHWVQAESWCNNIAWNVGPITSRTYQLAIERYEWNRVEKYKSIVPMIHLTWNIARNLPIRDTKLYDLVRKCLMRSFQQVCLSLDFVKSCDIEVKFHGRDDDVTHYCAECDLEVFNVLFVQKQLDNKYNVHCIDCAKEISPTLDNFTVLEEFYMSELVELYDNFKMQSVTA